MKKSQKLMAITLCAAIFMGLTIPSGLAASVDANEPVMQAFSKTGLGGSELQFTQEDFLNRISDEYTLKGIVIASLPDASVGVLKFGARDILTGEAIPTETLNTLKFVPSTTQVINTNFTFLPVFNEEAPLEQVTVGINLLGKDNRAPVAEDFSIETCKNVAITKMFKATDPDGDPLTFKISGKPKRGQVEIMDDGSLQYTPYENKTGKDSMTYIAIDSFGNESNEAKIEIVIEKAPARVTYNDMTGNPAQYAALKMAEKGIFVGEKIGDSYYFNPQAEMSRGQFLAMMVTALGLSDGTEVTRTGFADDNDIPAWVKPYASAALKNGIISGITTADGRKAFYAESAMTRAEAAVLVNNACQIENVGVLSVFAEGEEVPNWASQAVSNLDAVDVLESYTDGTMGLSDTITREQAVQLAYNALQYKESQDKKGGLLSWAFS